MTLIFTMLVAAISLTAGVTYARTLDCSGDHYRGTNGADTMNGGTQDDKTISLDSGHSFFGGGGNDRVFCVRGQDVLRG